MRASANSSTTRMSDWTSTGHVDGGRLRVTELRTGRGARRGWRLDPTALRFGNHGGGLVGRGDVLVHLALVDLIFVDEAQIHERFGEQG